MLPGCHLHRRLEVYHLLKVLAPKVLVQQCRANLVGHASLPYSAEAKQLSVLLDVPTSSQS